MAEEEQSFQDKPKFIEALEGKWETWTGISDPEIGEALKDLSGYLYHELRRLQAISLTAIEGELTDGGALDITQEELARRRDTKEVVKNAINETWQRIIGRQKVGMDKMCIIVRRHLMEKESANGPKK